MSVDPQVFQMCQWQTTLCCCFFTRCQTTRKPRDKIKDSGFDGTHKMRGDCQLSDLSGTSRPPYWSEWVFHWCWTLETLPEWSTKMLCWGTFALLWSGWRTSQGMQDNFPTILLGGFVHCASLWGWPAWTGCWSSSVSPQTIFSQNARTDHASEYVCPSENKNMKWFFTLKGTGNTTAWLQVARTQVYQSTGGLLILLNKRFRAWHRHACLCPMMQPQRRLLGGQGRFLRDLLVQILDLQMGTMAPSKSIWVGWGGGGYGLPVARKRAFPKTQRMLADFTPNLKRKPSRILAFPPSGKTAHEASCKLGL